MFFVVRWPWWNDLGNHIGLLQVTSQAYLAGGSSGHCSHQHSFSSLVSETPHCLPGIAKDTLTFSELMEGGGRNGTWAWTDLGSSGASVSLCVWQGSFQASWNILTHERGGGEPPSQGSEDWVIQGMQSTWKTAQLVGKKQTFGCFYHDQVYQFLDAHNFFTFLASSEVRVGLMVGVMPQFNW